MTNTVINEDIELRKLPADILNSVEEDLETNQDWKRFMSLIPKNMETISNEHYEPKYNGEDIRMIENYANANKVKCAKVLFGEWGTSGRVRPTLNTLLTLLIKAEMFKAADAIAKMLGKPTPERPTDGPAARIDFSISSLLNTSSVTHQLTMTSDPGNKTTTQMKSKDLIEFSTVDALRQHLSKQTLDEIFEESHDEPAPVKPSLSSETESKNNEIPNMFLSITADSQFVPKSLLDLKTDVNINTSDTPASLQSDTDTLPSHSYVTQSTPAHSFQTSKFYEHADPEVLEDNRLIQFPFAVLQAATNNFTGTLIGSGGFGDVFLGEHEGLGSLAVKKLNEKQSPDIVTKMFNREVKFLALLNHKNIVLIQGFSLDGPERCIVCEYINGGSLKQKIAEQVLNKSQRMNIIIGTAEGLRYIHNTMRPTPNSLTTTSSYLCHGDVKSDNILLTAECVPKLCDFGLAKQLESTYHMTSNILGTMCYMAPESMSGTFTQKSDVYSYGIVTLEILTGLSAIIMDETVSRNIKDYLRKHCINGDITQYVDKVVGTWPEAQDLYNLVKKCLQYEPEDRPSMDEILEKVSLLDLL